MAKIRILKDAPEGIAKSDYTELDLDVYALKWLAFVHRFNDEGCYLYPMDFTEFLRQEADKIESCSP